MEAPTTGADLAWTFRMQGRVSERRTQGSFRWGSRKASTVGMEQRKRGRHGPRKDRSRNGRDLGHKRPAWEEQEWLDGESRQRVGVSGKVQESGLSPVQEGRSLGSSEQELEF